MVRLRNVLRTNAALEVNFTARFDALTDLFETCKSPRLWGLGFRNDSAHAPGAYRDTKMFDTQ